MKKLRIAQIAPLWFSIPPKKYGGTERIISLLTEELVKRGHKVTLFASGDSKTKANLLSPVKRGLIAQNITWEDYWWDLFNHALAFEKANKFDIIHCHWNMLGVFFQKFIKTPTIHTMHNIPSTFTQKISYKRWKIFEYYKKNLNLVFISNSEKKNALSMLKKVKNNWVVYNGIDTSLFKFNPNPKDYFVWIARICPAKGVENAIKIAKTAKIKLVLAGQIQNHFQQYFKEKIKPHLGSQIKYIGEISQEQLSDFYGSARGCLYPIKWEEPFGLIMAESMACGTPVIAFRRGSVPEIIKHGKTGFIVKNIKETVNAIKKIDQIKRENCRKWVEKKFSVKKMVNDYEKIYYQLLKK